MMTTMTMTMTTTTTTANLFDLESSSDSDISLKDCLKADFNLVTIDKHDNPTGMLGRPCAELNDKDEIRPLAKNLVGMICHGKLTKKMLVSSVTKAHNEKDICNDKTSTTPQKSKDCPF